jgi:pyruvate formate lyase activating enzyme
MKISNGVEIGGLQKLTLIDYPGRLAATVFLCGCNFRCPWCYSSELVLPEKIKKQPKISEKEFLDFLKERQGLLEGVVICGGEPTINKNLPQFCRKIKKLGYLVKLDTNGSNPKMLKKLFDEKLVDYVAMDIKAPLGINFQFSISNFQKNSESQISKYETATGVKAETDKIKESIKLIKNSDVDYEFRTTVVPGIHQKEDILQIARDISPAKRYFLQNFRPEKNIDPAFEKIKPYPQEFLLEIQKAISPFFEVCQVR